MSADQDWEDVTEPSCTGSGTDDAPGNCTRTSIVAVEPCATTVAVAHHVAISTAHNRLSVSADTGLGHRNREDDSKYQGRNESGLFL